jgi:5-methylcytosine-specific restriction endonuclease McrA
MATMFKSRRVRVSRADLREIFFEICRRQEWRCALCHELKPLTCDHKIKRSQGGGDEATNLRGLCWKCHDAEDNQGGKSKRKRALMQS